ncbi:unnamed protein product [Durusdinium trenchii]|uniref:Uncharacterized protein n=1 Tax=Durusdinium trenchii TaxID=1381693 RepID=A0ABP0M9X1_9DINO
MLEQEAVMNDGPDFLPDLMQQALQEHVTEERSSKVASPETDVPRTGRFTSRLRKAPAAAPTWPQQRPGRLLGLVHAPTECGQAAGEMPALRHLALLEEAVLNGTELPPLCKLAGAQPPSAPKAPKEGRPNVPHAPPTRSQRAPRLLVADGTWGIQPPDSTQRRRPAAQAAPLGGGRSQLRGVGLARRGAGAAQTARWVSMEAERLREQARQPKPLGLSFATAFLVNGGPERMEPLSAGLCAIAPIS